MYLTIKGLYENGRIVFYEQPPIDTPTEVLITFTSMPPNKSETKQRKGGYAIDYVGDISPDFDEPLDDLKDYI